MSKLSTSLSRVGSHSGPPCRQGLAACLVAAALALTPRSGLAEIAGESWFPIGPAPITGFFAGGNTGRATAIEPNPFNADHFYLGGAAGGVWETRNAGKTWDAIMNRTPALAVGSIRAAECTAGSCTRIYVGSGENAIRRDTYHGRGVFVGTPDEFGRWSWRITTRGTSFDFTHGSVVDLVLDPATSGDTRVLYLALSSGTTVSASEATVTAPVPSSGYGIYKSTDDGLTWTRLTSGLPADALPSDLDLVPPAATGGPMRLYASFSGERGGPASGGVYLSETAGSSWTKLDNGLPAADRVALRGTQFDHVELAVSPNLADTLYASVGYCSDRLGRCSGRVDVYRSTNGGTLWEFRGAPTVSSYSRYTHVLTVAPGDDERIFWGGVPLQRSDNGGQTFVASDGLRFCSISGLTEDCVVTFDGLTRVHSDMRELVFHPADSSRALLTGDGGFTISFDAGLSWVPRNDGLNIVGFHTVGTSADFGAIIAGSQDNGIQIWNGEPRWRQAGDWSQDGGVAIIDRVEGVPPGNQVLYGGGNSGILRFSSNAGAGWTSLTSGYASDGARIMYAPAVQDADAPFDIYTGGNRVYKRARGTSAGSWQDVSGVLVGGTSSEIRTSPTQFTNSITAIALATVSTRAYAGYYLGEVFVSDNPGVVAWNRVGAGRLPNAPVTSLAVDPDDPDTAYATFSGFGSEAKVWKTETGGASWSPIASGLPPGVPVNTIAVEETAPRNVLWIGLDSHPAPVGSEPRRGPIYKSRNGGDSWLQWSQGLPNVPVFEIEIDEAHQRAIAATHGRGAYLLGEPQLNNYEGWVDDGIWDVPIFGQNFLPNQSCVVTLRQTDGSECASGSIDGAFATVGTDGDGVLSSTREDGTRSWYRDKPVAWACLNSTCINGVHIRDCNDDADGDGDRDPLSEVEVNCGGQIATLNILGCPPLSNPPSSVFDVEGLPGPGGMAPAPGGGGPQNVVLLTASLKTLSSTTSLCTVAVPAADPGSTDDFVERARSAIESNTTCAANGVFPEIMGSEPGPDEDQFGSPRQIAVRAPSLTGGQLVTAVGVVPGELARTCVRLGELGLPLLGQLQIMTVNFGTGAAGARGGDLLFAELTPLGPCAVSIPTTPGQSSGDIAQALVDALETPGIPGPHPQCPSRRNMRDVSRHGDSIVTVSADVIKICTTDPGVGVTIRPEDLFHTHPVAVAAVNEVGGDLELDGTGSLDADSTPGTRDDIVAYDWFRLEGATAIALGSGDQLLLTGAVPERVRLRVIDRQGLADITEIDLDADPDEPLAFAGTPGPVLSVHLGGTVPVGTLGRFVDPGWSLGLDGESPIGSRTSVLAFLRHQRFDQPGRSDLALTSLTADVRRYFSGRTWHWYAQGGGGFYFANRGDDEFGLNGGVGVHLRLRNPKRAVEVGLDLHWLDPTGDDLLYLAPEVAFKFRF